MERNNPDWYHDDFKVLNVRKVKIGSVTALIPNVFPFECYDYVNMEDASLDDIWAGRADAIVVPSDIRMQKALIFHSECAARLETRRNSAMQSAVSNGISVNFAQLKCWCCKRCQEIETAYNDAINLRDEFAKITMY